ncbi:MAG: helix-turn-helix domain-containing protein [Anaerolineae bacterium]|nr:helix-turn-helix domain-containing protein [Candidatus Roseilinea sp.]MDW8448807.1 helix-turn-helix domain-containing protein [Anaerolineae bacterium]
MPDWITTTEAAEISGYHVNYLRQIIRKRKIKAEKRGRDWWVDKDSLLTYLKGASTSKDKRRGPKSA